MYKHASLRLHYTRYDTKREAECINPKGAKPDIMVLSGDINDLLSPFWYARVIGVYHSNIYWRGEEELRRVDFLHVRWFERIIEGEFGDATGLWIQRTSCVQYT